MKVVLMSFSRWFSGALFGATRDKQARPPVKTGRQTEAAVICGTPGGIGQRIVPQAEEPRTDVLESIPRRELVWDQSSNEKQKKVSKPEDLIGMTGRMNGVPYKFDSILGRGDNKVVF